MEPSEASRRLAMAAIERRPPPHRHRALATVLLAAAALVAAAAVAQEPSLEAGWLELEGAWTASGTREVLGVGPQRSAAIIHLSGSVVLTKPGSLSPGFRSEAIGFEDVRGASVGQGLWTDERGDQVFIDVRGERSESGHRIVGTISGGTGRYAGIEGGYEFEWKYVIADPEGGIQGWGVGMKGRVRLPASGEAPR